MKRTEAYIKEHLHEPLNVEILAEHAGVSVRTLFTGFKNYLGTTPMSYLKELRFEQAHLELMHNENLSVTDVAFKWGFSHLGRFLKNINAVMGNYHLLPAVLVKAKAQA